MYRANASDALAAFAWEWRKDAASDVHGVRVKVHFPQMKRPLLTFSALTCIFVLEPFYRLLSG